MNNKRAKSLSWHTMRVCRRARMSLPPLGFSLPQTSYGRWVKHLVICLEADLRGFFLVEWVFTRQSCPCAIVHWKIVYGIVFILIILFNIISETAEWVVGQWNWLEITIVLVQWSTRCWKCGQNAVSIYELLDVNSSSPYLNSLHGHRSPHYTVCVKPEAHISCNRPDKWG